MPFMEVLSHVKMAAIRRQACPPLGTPNISPRAHANPTCPDWSGRSGLWRQVGVPRFIAGRGVRTWRHFFAYLASRSHVASPDSVRTWYHLLMWRQGATWRFQMWRSSRMWCQSVAPLAPVVAGSHVASLTWRQIVASLDGSKTFVGTGSGAAKSGLRTWCHLPTWHLRATWSMVSPDVASGAIDPHSVLGRRYVASGGLGPPGTCFQNVPPVAGRFVQAAPLILAFAFVLT